MSDGPFSNTPPLPFPATVEIVPFGAMYLNLWLLKSEKKTPRSGPIRNPSGMLIIASVAGLQERLKRYSEQA